MQSLVKLEDLPQPPTGVTFHLKKVDKITLPHPYVIGQKHVVYASDHGGVLDEHNIRGAELAGASCCQCHRPMSEHETMITLFIVVPAAQQHDLNSVPGLHNYLYTNKPAFAQAGIQGFAFPTS